MYKVRKLDRKGAFRVELEGEIGSQASAELREAVEEIIRTGRINGVVNLDRLRFLDANTLDALIHIQGVLRRLGGGINLVCSNTGFREILAVTGLNQLFKSYDNEEDAVKAFTPPLNQCFSCPFFQGIANCPTLRSLVYPCELCEPEARLPWLNALWLREARDAMEERLKTVRGWRSPLPFEHRLHDRK